jgi:hypothetical protein
MSEEEFFSNKYFLSVNLTAYLSFPACLFCLTNLFLPSACYLLYGQLLDSFIAHFRIKVKKLRTLPISV